MNGKKRQVWIEEGYKLFSVCGKDGLSVELLARETGKSKSSFYHYFGDMDAFIEVLLDYHMQHVKANAARIKDAKSLDPEVFDIFIETKMDSFFHKQLRLNRSEPIFQPYITESTNLTVNAMLDVWKKALNLDTRPLLAKSFLALVSDNFLLRITPNNYNKKWLENYFKEISDLLSQMK